MTLLVHNKGQTDYERAGPQGERPLVLFHTLLADRSVYDGIFAELAKNRDVVRFHFPGCGASTGSCASIDDYADWTIAFINALNFGQAVDIFSNGFGGFVSVGVTAKSPQLVRQLIIANSGAAFPEERKLPLLKMAEAVDKMGVGAVLDTAISRMFPPQFADAHPDIVQARRQALLQTDGAQFAVACRALAALDYTDLARRIERPVTVVAGLDDGTTPPSMSQTLHQLIAGSSYREIADCGHCPQIQQPQQVLALLQ
jgi:3-oxoadipate enol-lactonase